MEEILLASYLTVYLIAGGIASLAVYVANAFIRMKMGEKAGIKSLWQAWVPFAQELLLVKMAGVPKRKVIFLGSYVGLVGMVLGALEMITLFIFNLSDYYYFENPFFWIISALIGIVDIIYLIYSICIFVGVYKALYARFNGVGSFYSVVPYLGIVFPVIITVADAIIAFNKKITYGSANAKSDSERRIKMATITGVAGMYAGQSFDVEDGVEIVFGRDPSCCNVIFSGTETAVSRNHCSVKYIGMSDTFLLTVYSKNGVICDGGERVGAGSSKMLRKGSIIAIGTETNRFILG